MPRGLIVSVFLLILAGVPSVSAQSPVPVNSTNPAISSGPSSHALQISAGDLLDVSVFDTPELSTKVRVDEHGTIALPLGGELSVSEMTAEQAGRAIEARLRQADILKDPRVSVAVLEYATQGVTVTGEVKNPGVYPLLGAHGVLDLISAAGGATPTAGKSVTVTHRADPDHPIVVKVESKPGSTAALRVDVSPGDTIMVPHAGIVYVIGDVGKPGGFLIENNDPLTVMQAIALAQGTNRTASLNNAKLIRKAETGRQEFPVPLKKILADKVADLVLVDGDILFIPSSAAKNALRDMQSVLPSVAGAAVYHVP